MATKLSKYIGYLHDMKIQVSQKLQERRYEAHSCTLKYIFQKRAGSDSLIVIFSGCTSVGVPARYNYMRTLKDVRCNKLFILDDYGLDQRGGYYLGGYPEFSFEKATADLIRETLHRNKIRHCYFIGSSKGGWAALTFGMKLDIPASKHIIVGAPQYWLGQYLHYPANRVTFDGICRNQDEDAVVATLDNYLQDVIRATKEDANKATVHLHYSCKEHTYAEHIAFLVEELQKNGYPLTQDVAEYPEHTDVGKFYPAFLLKTLSGLMDASKKTTGSL